jgi:hypothetical protein
VAIGGVDFRDLAFRFEREYRVQITRQDFELLLSRRDPPDIAAGELVDLVISKGPHVKCPRCGYDLYGSNATGLCPECGGPFAMWKLIWVLLAGLVVDATGVKPDSVSPKTLLIGDLGF